MFVRLCRSNIFVVLCTTVFQPPNASKEMERVLSAAYGAIRREVPDSEYIYLLRIATRHP